MKSGVVLTLCPLLSLVLCTVHLDPSQIQVSPQNGAISGVFMVMLKNKVYSFNATTAIEVCTSLSVKIATKAEVERAHRNGFQTCSYGWIKEQIAVIPRIEANEKCGQKKVGVVTWTASVSKEFNVFCFNSTGQTEATTTAIPRMTKPTDTSPQPKTITPSLTHSTLFNQNFLSPSPSAPSISSGFSTSATSTFFLFTGSSSATRSTQSLLPSTSHYPLPISLSSTAVSFSSTVLSSHLSTSSSTLNTLSNQTGPLTQPSDTSSFGEVPTACVIIAVMLVLMAAAGAVWYFKIKRTHSLPSWVRMRHKDNTETEMWKHTDQQRIRKKDKGNSSDDIILQLEEDTESP